MDDLPYLSPTEWRVMSALWRLPEGGTVEQISQLLGDEKLSKRDIGTLLNRIMQKGYAASRPSYPPPPVGRPPLFYNAVVPYLPLLKREIERFIDSYILDNPAALEVVGEITLEHLRRLGKFP